MKKIIVFANMDLPEGSAGATRCIAFGHLAELCGYKVILLGVNYSKTTMTKGIYEGLEYQLIDFMELESFGVKRFLRRRKLKMNALKWLEENCDSENSKCIITYGFRSELSWLIQFSQKKEIPIIKDVVEWYDKKDFRGIKGFFNLIEDRIGLYFWNRKCKNIIAISTLLENFYKKRDCNVIRIPTILDCDKFKYLKITKNAKIVISYAGSPANKDNITNVVKAVLFLKEKEREMLQLDFYGITWDFFRKNKLKENEIEILKNSVKCHGRISYDEVKKRIHLSDFTILLRPDRRSSHAGFPTKIGESMAMGVPVITNITSDLNLYIHNKIEGILCENETPVECAKVLRDVLKRKKEENIVLREKARECALRSFDYRVYKEKFDFFIQQLRL